MSEISMVGEDDKGYTLCKLFFIGLRLRGGIIINSWTGLSFFEECLTELINWKKI